MKVINMTAKGEGMFLLPPAAHLCQTCATAHEPHPPHNAQTLFYQTKFNMEHGRSATWLDAMAHCSDAMKAAWREGLIEKGVDVDGGKINPERHDAEA
ncbi:hypothetical protein [uncultured Brevundimonas sp.]|uniref:hypothetical protein n=1 Tax=uncultured Brevundimonas sp. TaxID=213418 RepID=UPI0025F6E3B3|nr:hypothetical protein [uncultured Brevundimonas sp.]